MLSFVSCGIDLMIIYRMSLCSALAYPIAEQIKKEKSGIYQVNRVDALSATKHLLIPVFYYNIKIKTLDIFDKIVGKSINKIKPAAGVSKEKKDKSPILNYLQKTVP